MTKTKCPNCGTEIEANDNYCKVCGVCVPEFLEVANADDDSGDDDYDDYCDDWSHSGLHCEGGSWYEGDMPLESLYGSDEVLDLYGARVYEGLHL